MNLESFNDNDLLSLIQLVKSIRTKVGDNLSYLHIGDVEWSFFKQKSNPNLHLHEQICIVRDNKNTAQGFGWLSKSNVEIIIDPDILHDQKRDLAIRLLSWAEEVAIKQGKNELICDVFEADIEFQNVVEELKFHRNYDDFIMRAELDLVSSMIVTLPHGFTLKHISSLEDFMKMKELREIITSKKFTTEKFKDLLALPDYDQDLHIIAVDDKGNFCAHALGWIDNTNKVGLFEPVATHPEYRKMGLGKAVLTECMKHLSKKGAKRVIVSPDSSNAAAVSLYRSVGCKDLSKFSGWKKVLE